MTQLKTITGTSGRDVIEGGPGVDTLTGGRGRDQFVHNSMADGGDSITDFTVGGDTLVFTKLRQSLVIITSADPLASGHVTCTASAAGAVTGLEIDAAAGPGKSRPAVQLTGLACSTMAAARFKF